MVFTVRFTGNIIISNRSYVINNYYTLLQVQDAVYSYSQITESAYPAATFTATTAAIRFNDLYVITQFIDDSQRDMQFQTLWKPIKTTINV